MNNTRIIDLSFDSKGLWTILIRERVSETPEVIKRITTIETINESEARRIFEEELKPFKKAKPRS